MTFLPKVFTAVIATVASVLLLGGCATQAQRQFQAMQADNTAALTQFRECRTAAYNGPESAALRAQRPFDVRMRLFSNCPTSRTFRQQSTMQPWHGIQN